jgi:hypothetical protein
MAATSYKTARRHNPDDHSLGWEVYWNIDSYNTDQYSVMKSAVHNLWMGMPQKYWIVYPRLCGAFRSHNYIKRSSILVTGRCQERSQKENKIWDLIGFLSNLAMCYFLHALNELSSFHKLEDWSSFYMFLFVHIKLLLNFLHEYSRHYFYSWKR